MAKKQAVQPAVKAPDGRVIDLLLPVLAKLGISVNRPRPDTLAGFIKGLLGDDVLIWCEIWGGGNEIHLKLSSTKAVFEDQEAEIRAIVERLNTLPEWGTDGGRWLRIALTQPRPSGGRQVMLIARITPLSGGELTPKFCEHILTSISDFVKKEWPLR